jgi:Ran GTPase-activating protein (RanGAP) involved in mRNA processing and transport
MDTGLIVDKSERGVGAGCIEELVSGFPENLWLKELTLYGNNITDAGAATMAVFLRRQNSVHRLVLSYNGITTIGARALVDALEGPWAAGIQRAPVDLTLDGNELEDAGAQMLAGRLSAEPRLLKDLSLRDNGITDAGALEFAGALAVPGASLRSLNLGENIEIGDIGAVQLSEALTRNVSLTRLDLDCCSLGDLGLRALARTANTFAHVLILSGPQQYALVSASYSRHTTGLISVSRDVLGLISRSGSLRSRIVLSSGTNTSVV